MQVLCITSEADQADIACPVCGQKYAVYFSRPRQPEREHALEAVLVTLSEHHALQPVVDASPSAHPADCFNVPAWSGPAHMSAAALLGGAPVRRTRITSAQLPSEVQPASKGAERQVRSD